MVKKQQSKDIDSIEERLETLATKSEQAKELTEEVDKIFQKRERASNKNNAFEDLEQKIVETREQHRQLQLWVEYANRMDVKIPENDILDQRSDTERELKSLIDKTWDDFADATTIRDDISKFEAHRTGFRDLTRTVRESVQEYVDDELESVDRKLTLLQIPDIGDDDADQTCRNYQYYLNKLADGKPTEDVSPDKWESHRADFHDLDIGLGQKLTDEAKSVIWSLLEDETVTLAEIDEAVLDDLKTFEEFSERLSIQFTTNP